MQAQILTGVLIRSFLGCFSRLVAIWSAILNTLTEKRTSLIQIFRFFLVENLFKISLLNFFKLTLSESFRDYKKRFLLFNNAVKD